MKIFINFLIFLSLFFGKISPENSFANEAQTTTYAKALTSCKLYKTKEMSDDYSDVLFIIPETYFVVVLDTVSDECFKVQYDRFIGYVDASTVTIATFVPIVKTLENITFDIKSTSGTQIWSEPTTKSNICTTISAGTKNLKYIAYSFGSIPSDGESNIWYYVFYTPDENSTKVYEGYIYSENTTNLSEIVANTECNPEIISNELNDENVILISSTLKTIIITIIIIPIILFFAIILYKLVQKFKKNTKYNKNQSLKNGDNFDEIKKNENFKRMNKFRSMKLLKNKNTSQDIDDFDDELL